MPRVRPRHGQVSTLGMAECPLSATPLREASQGHVKTARTDSVQVIVRPLIANRLPPTAESEILTKQPPFFHSPTRAIPRSVTVGITVRHCEYYGPSPCIPQSVTVGITVTDRGVPHQEHVRGGGAGLSEPEYGRKKKHVIICAPQGSERADLPENPVPPKQKAGATGTGSPA